MREAIDLMTSLIALYAYIVFHCLTVFWGKAHPRCFATS